MHRRIKDSFRLLLILLLIFTVAGCEKSSETTSKLPGPNDRQEILITGLQDADCRVSVGEIKKLPSVTKRVEASRANGEKVSMKATGALLESLLEKHGKSMRDYSRIRLTARDGYSIAVTADVFKNNPIILAYEIDGQALDAENQPIQVVVPGERAMYWVRMLTRIDLETGDEQIQVKKIVFLEAAVKGLPQEDYQYFENVDKAIKTRDLVNTYAGGVKAANVFMRARDGLQKNESPGNFLGAFIKISGQDAPVFLAPDMPQGMHVRELFLINYGGTSFMAYSQGKKLLPSQTVRGQNGIALSDVIKQTGLTPAAKYRFNSVDGPGLVLSVGELEKALVCENSQGWLTFCCPGDAGKTVERLLSIECLK